jgi:hypothetical protein
MLVNHHFKLAFKFGLLFGVWQPCSICSKAGHILDYHDPELITSLIE